jgi:hypothetical protein
MTEPDILTRKIGELMEWQRVAWRRVADGVVLAKTDTDYFRNPGVAANRREEFAIWSPDSRMVIRKLHVRYGTGEFTLYRIGPDGALAGDIDLIKMVEPAVHAPSGRLVATPRTTCF